MNGASKLVNETKAGPLPHLPRSAKRFRLGGGADAVVDSEAGDTPTAGLEFPDSPAAGVLGARRPPCEPVDPAFPDTALLELPPPRRSIAEMTLGLTG